MTMNFNLTIIKSENLYIKNKKDIEKLKMPMPD